MNQTGEISDTLFGTFPSFSFFTLSLTLFPGFLLCFSLGSSNTRDNIWERVVYDADGFYFWGTEI